MKFFSGFRLTRVNVTVHESLKGSVPQQKEGSLLVPESSFTGPERKMKPDSLQGGPGVSCKGESFIDTLYGHFNFYCHVGCMKFYSFALILKNQF